MKRRLQMQVMRQSDLQWMENLQTSAEMTDASKEGNRMDCSPEFIGAMMNAVYIGTMRKVRLVAPFMWDTKADIVTKAAKYRAPLHLTWSCYRGGDAPCGNCPTCRERINAFKLAGYLDPVEYEDGAFDADPNHKRQPFPRL